MAENAADRNKRWAKEHADGKSYADIAGADGAKWEDVRKAVQRQNKSDEKDAASKEDTAKGS